MAGGGGAAAACRLYLVTPPSLPDGFADLLAAALDAGDVACLQLRLKGADPGAVRRAADALLPVAHARDVAVLLNDDAALAVAAGLDGAHLGQSDGDHAAARRLLGEGRTLGVTCHASRHLAMEAGEAGADYVAFGAFFSSTSKQVTSLADPDILSWWSERTELPCCAIGGITAANLAPLVRTGADLLAIIGGVWSHPDGPAAGVRAIAAAIKAAAG